MERFSWNDIRQGDYKPFNLTTEGHNFSYSQDTTHIFKTWESVARANFKNKTGMTYEEFEDRTSFFAQIYDGITDGTLQSEVNSNMVNVYNQIDNNIEKYKKAISEETGLAIGAGFGSVVKGENRSEKVLSATKDLLNEYSRFSDTMVSQLSKELVDFAGQGKLSDPDVAQIEPGELPKSLSISKTAAKTITQLDQIVKATQTVINDTEGRKTIAYQKYKWKDSKKNPATLIAAENKSRRQADSIIKAIGGQVSNGAGMLFEQAILVEGAKAVGGILKAMTQAGAEKKDGKTSKADAILTLYKDSAANETYNINMSVKKISLESGDSRYLDTNLGVLTNQYLSVSSDTQIAIAISVIERNFNKKGDSLNKFLSAAAANIAIGGVGKDKVDFIMYKNQGMSLAHRMALEAKKQHIKITTTPKQPPVLSKKNWIEEKNAKTYLSKVRAELK